MNQPNPPLTLGVLAHVDAGKTTLSEALLYTAGVLPAMGRVDHRAAFLDTHQLERDRGITIFSKQARFDTGRWTPPATWTSPRRWSAPWRCWTAPCW